jgi:endo-1,4-beta-xylanase
MEDPTGYSTVGTSKGTVVSDGATYEICEHQQVNQPSIESTSSTFNQYISVRQTPRTNGTVTVENHFAAWAAQGMSLGTLNYQVMAVESWSGSGEGTITVSKGTASSNSSAETTTTKSSECLS